MSHFDELVSKYRTMNYGNLQSQNPSAVSSLLDDYNDRKYFTSHLEGMDNRWVRDAQGNLQFSTPSGLLESGTGTGYATYDPSVDYGDPGYAEMFQPSPSPYAYQGTTLNRPEGSGKGPMHMREDLHAASKAMGWENLGTYQNPTYKDQGGDTFTFSKDLPYGQVYDQYGRKRTVDFEGFTGNLQGFLADPWGAIKQGFGVEGQETDPTTFESSYPSNYDPNIEGSGGFVQPDKGPPTTGDPKPGAPFGQPMGGNQNGGGGNFGGANVGSHNDGSKGGNKTGTARF